jgi:tetratricopeptide (TPR) repeat protein
MTAELAENPASLVFVPLAEELRRRGQLDAALKVALAGVARYPTLPEAQDLAARIHADRGELDRAFDAWQATLAAAPEHGGAHKGLGFLYYRAGERERAREHLEAAARLLPDDEGVQRALARVSGAVAEPVIASAEGAKQSDGDAPHHPTAAAAAPPRDDDTRTAAPRFSLDDTGAPSPGDADVFAGLEGSADGLMLVDSHGLRLGGGLLNHGTDVADEVAAQLAGVSRKAARAARLLELGPWESLAVECPFRNFHLSAPTDETVLLAARDPGTPAGRLALVAERATRAARRWLEQLA